MIDIGIYTNVHIYEYMYMYILLRIFKINLVEHFSFLYLYIAQHRGKFGKEKSRYPLISRSLIIVKKQFFDMDIENILQFLTTINEII